MKDLALLKQALAEAKDALESFEQLECIGYMGFKVQHDDLKLHKYIDAALEELKNVAI